MEDQCLLFQTINMEERPQPFNNKVWGILMFWLNCFRLTSSALFQRSGTSLNTSHLTETFYSFGTGKLQLFHFSSPLLYKISGCVQGGGIRPFVRMFWISCSLQQKTRTTELLNDLEIHYLLHCTMNFKERPKNFKKSLRYSNVLIELFQIEIISLYLRNG
jgi:hypothetical protein